VERRRRKNKLATIENQAWLRAAVILLSIFSAISEASSQSAYEGLIQSASGTETIEKRFAPPAWYARDSVDEGSYVAWLRGLPLLPKNVPATDWQSRQVFAPAEVGGVLDWRLLGAEEQCADIALRLLAEHARAQNSLSDVWFRSLSGQEIRWSQWLKGIYGTNRDVSSITFREGGVKSGTPEEFDRYLSFVMTYTNTKSMARDWPKIQEADLRIGDVIIQPHCTGQGMGHLSVVVDASQNEAGVRRYIFVDGFTPARLPVVRQQTTGDQASVWMTPAEYLKLQEQFGPGIFHRFPGW
jgi:hypothetical protein